MYFSVGFPKLRLNFYQPAHNKKQAISIFLRGMQYMLLFLIMSYTFLSFPIFYTDWEK